MRKVDLLRRIGEEPSESLGLCASLFLEAQRLHATGEISDVELEAALSKSMVASVRRLITSGDFSDNCLDQNAIGYVAVNGLIPESELAGIRFDHGETLDYHVSRLPSSALQDLREKFLGLKPIRLDRDVECGAHSYGHHD